MSEHLPSVDDNVTEVEQELYEVGSAFVTQDRWIRAKNKVLTDKAAVMLWMVLLKCAADEKPWAMKLVRDETGGGSGSNPPRTYQVPLPKLVSAAACAEAHAVIAEELCSGRLSSDEAMKWSNFVENARKSYISVELEQRVDALELQNERGY